MVYSWIRLVNVGALWCGSTSLCHYDGCRYPGMWKVPGSHLNIKTVFPGMGIPMLKIRRSWYRLIFNMGIPILVRRHLDIEMPPGHQEPPYYWHVCDYDVIRVILPVKPLNKLCWGTGKPTGLYLKSPKPQDVVASEVWMLHTQDFARKWSDTSLHKNTTERQCLLKISLFRRY